MGCSRDGPESVKAAAGLWERVNITAPATVAVAYPARFLTDIASSIDEAPRGNLS
jgi:hypothetical protein